MNIALQNDSVSSGVLGVVHRLPTAQLATMLLSATLPLAGCVCEAGPGKEQPPARPRELAFYDFVREPEVASAQLWPPDDRAPKRKKRDLLTRQSGQDLVATVDGKDPYFVWDFEAVARAAALSVELESGTEGRLQLFWANDDCKFYEERCSTTAQVAPGSQTVEFVLDPGSPLHGVRLDLPETNGVEVRIRRIRLFERPRLSSGYEPRNEHTEARSTPAGLRITSRSPDPWLTFDTPWLEAEHADAIEVELSLPPGAVPELFWAGTACAQFGASCRIGLTAVDGRANVHEALLAGLPTWRGKISHLRFDPGELPGDYLLKSLVLVRRGQQR